ICVFFVFFFSSRRRHTRCLSDWSSDVCSSDLKPFGCMPSTQSDGAQSAVVSNYKDMIYLPVETSGEGEINAHSRVQMALGEAKRSEERRVGKEGRSRGARETS